MNSQLCVEGHLKVIVTLLWTPECHTASVAIINGSVSTDFDEQLSSLCSCTGETRNGCGLNWEYFMDCEK